MEYLTMKQRGPSSVVYIVRLSEEEEAGFKAGYFSDRDIITCCDNRKTDPRNPGQACHFGGFIRKLDGREYYVQVLID